VAASDTLGCLDASGARRIRGGLLGRTLVRQTKGQFTTMVVRLRVTSPALRACCSCSNERTRLRCAPAFQVTSTTAHRGGYAVVPGTTSAMLLWPLTPLVKVQMGRISLPGATLTRPSS
jgi:hypothetical protein